MKLSSVSLTALPDVGPFGAFILGCSSLEVRGKRSAASKQGARNPAATPRNLAARWLKESAVR